MTRFKTTTFVAWCMLSYVQHIGAAQPPGYVIEWGMWNSTNTTPKSGWQITNDVTAVSAGRFLCLALKKDGTILQWGWNYHGQPTFENTSLTTGVSGYTNKTGFHVT